MKKEYCLGFAFSSGFRETPRVLLIKKNKPDFQKGKLNGLGGKLEFGEDYRQAMTREFAEECGVYVLKDSWIHFATMEFSDCSVACFSIQLSDEAWGSVETITDEEIGRFPLDEMFSNYNPKMPNLCWLVPMALSSLTNKEKPLIIQYDSRD